MMMAQDKFDDASNLLSAITVTRRDPVSGQIPSLLLQARAHSHPTREQLIGSFRYNADWKDLDCC
jgi:hypothetical protein